MKKKILIWKEPQHNPSWNLESGWRGVPSSNERRGLWWQKWNLRGK